MRLTAFILAILILVLSCLPCADVDAMPDIKTELTNHNESDYPHEHQDLCSPFCHCSCCAVYSVVNTPLSLPEKIELNTSPIYTSYLSKEVIEISLPVWQPPRL